MAKIQVKGIKQLASRLNASLRISTNKLFRDTSIRLSIGKIVVSDIKKNVDFGRASQSTIRARKYLEKYNSTDTSYSRSKIKGIFSGELFNDLENNVKGDTNNLEFLVEHTDKNHKRYQGKNGSIGKSISFSKLSSILIDDMGYDYLQLSSKAKKEIVVLVRNRFFDILKRQ